MGEAPKVETDMAEIQKLVEIDGVDSSLFDTLTQDQRDRALFNRVNYIFESQRTQEKICPMQQDLCASKFKKVYTFQFTVIGILLLLIAFLVSTKVIKFDQVRPLIDLIL
jgi:hypothetical protein